MNRIAVLMGGVSAEREVSLRSGAAVSAALVELGYEVMEIDVGPGIVEQLYGLRDSVDAAFIALHGRLGEDGTVQALMELLGVPYTGSGVMASALAIDKHMSKQVFRANGIPVAEDMVVTSAEVAVGGVSEVSRRVSIALGFPCIVKPNCEGSTVGMNKAVDQDELEEAIGAALAYDDLLVIERYIEGREMTVGILGDRPLLLPVLEVIASKGIYDYECKYTRGMTEYIVPACIEEEMARELQDISHRAHIALRCQGFSRVDLMLDGEGGIYCLEVNTIPGMTELSLIPKAAAATGLTLAGVVEIVLGSAMLRAERGKRCY